MHQFEYVKKIVDARRCGNAVGASEAEKAYIRDFIGGEEAESNSLENEGHQDYEGMTAFERTETLGNALFEAFDGAQSVVESPDYLTRKQWHPFFLSQKDLGILWNLRKRLDDIGVPYPLFAYAAMSDWLIYKKLRRFPTMSDLADEGIIVTVLDFWSDPDLDDIWDKGDPCSNCETGLLS